MTSLTGESVRIYPMPVWLALEERLARAPSTHPARIKFLDRVNYFGQTAEIDAQGRVVIHQRLRESAGMAGEVDVLRLGRSPRRVEPRSPRREDAERSLHRRRRAGRCRSSGSDRWPSRTNPSWWPRSLEPARAVARRPVRRLHGRARRPQPRAARGGRDAAASASIATRRRWRSRARRCAPFGDRVELVHADYRELDRVLDERGIAGVVRRARRSRRVVDAARRRGPRLQLPPRRAARHAHGSESRARAPRTCCATSRRPSSPT